MSRSSDANSLLKMYFLLFHRGRKRFVSEGDGGRLKPESY